MTFVRSILLVASLSVILYAQSPGTVTIRLELSNQVSYADDEPDRTRWATSNQVTPALSARNFGTATSIADLVAVNGRPAKGALVCRIALFLTASNNPNFGISDAGGGADALCTLTILQDEGTPVGTISFLGKAGSMRPPGAPSSLEASPGIVIGGTGAYYGVRGQIGFQGPGSNRNASVREDPFLRRLLGGGNRYINILHLIPWRRPEITAVYHENFAPVTEANPARSGEVLILRAAGLGPTRPGVDPDQPFPAQPIQEVNSPVEVSIAGQDAEVMNKFGWPGTVDMYRIDIRVPRGLTPGIHPVRIGAAWISGLTAPVPVQ